MAENNESEKTRGKAWVLILVSIMIGSAFISIAGNAAANQGGDGSYGYGWTDSKSPSPKVTYNWIEVGGTGTLASAVSGDDVYGGPYEIGFTFPFYGNSYTQLYVCTNGFITFGSGASTWNNDGIPSTNFPNNFLAPYWDDLYVQSGTGTVYYQMLGSAPNRQFVVEWDQVNLFGGSNLMTFEAILNETGDIWFQYNSLNGVIGGSATVGIENAAGIAGNQYSYFAASLSDGLAIRFSRGPLGIGPSQSKSDMMGATVSYDLTIFNNQAFADSFDLTSTSVFGWSINFYDSTGTVLLTDTNGDLHGYPDTGNIPAGGAFSLVAKVSIPPSPASSQDIENITATSFSNDALSGSTTLTTSVISAQFNPPYADHGQDTDANGFYNYLVVDVPMNVHMAGWYQIGSYLLDGAMNYVTSANNYTYLSAGLHTVELQYAGLTLFNNGWDGTYGAYINLYDSNYSYLDSDSYTTGSYLHTQFERPGAFFAPPFIDYGNDTNGNGLYDYLVVEVPVNVTTAGSYEVEGYLYDGLMNYVSNNYNYTYLSAGMRTVEQRYAGMPLYNNGWDGNYSIYLYLYDSTYNTIDTDLYTTNYYAYSQFESPGATAAFAPPHSDHGVDTDGNGLFDHLALEVSINVTVAGWYEIVSYLYDGAMNYVSYDDNYTYLSAGLKTVELHHFGLTLYNHGWDGTYGVDLDLYDSHYSYLDSDSYTTGSYLHTQFETPVAAFASPHSDHGVDTNGNGLYDYLAVEVSVNVITAGWYTISGNSMFSASNYTYLGSGLQIVELRFPSTMFSLYKWNTSPSITLYLYNASMNSIDYEYYTANYYTYDQFEPSPIEFYPPHSDHGADTDGDGFYEYLAVDEVVNVTVAGYYSFLSILFNGGMTTQIASASNNSVYLPTGTHTVEILFPAGSISASGFNGPYIVEMVAVDVSSGNLIAIGIYSTNNYTAGQFEAASASFGLPFSDHGLDTNGNGFYDYLVVDAPVNVVVPGTYEVTGALSGPWLQPVTTASNTTYLAAGLHTVELRFDGNAICISGYNAPYMVVLELRNAANVQLDGRLYSTSGAYDWNDFEGAGETDSTPPTTSLILNPPAPDGLNGWYVSRVDVTLLANDNPGGSGIDHTYYRTQINGGSWGSWNAYAGNFSLEANGTYDIEYYSVDDAGNSELHQYETVKIDHASPTTVSHSFDYTLILSAADNEGGSGVNKTWYSVDNGTWQAYVGRLSVGSTGTYFIRYYSVDNAGNSEAVRNFTLPRFDGIAPTTTATLLGTAGYDGWFTSAVGVLLAAVDDSDGSGVNNTFYRVDGGSWGTYSGTPISVAIDGTHSVGFYSRDYAGNTEAAKSVTFKIDTVAPIFATMTANDTVFSSDQVQISFDVSDSMSGLYYYEYSFDGFVPLSNTTLGNLTGTYSCTVGTQLTEGDHYIVIRLVDRAGNVNETRLDFKVHISGSLIAGVPDWTLLSAIIIVIAVVLISLLLLRRKKSPPKRLDEMKPEQPAPPAV